MKVLLIGASGRTGRRILAEALRRGHEVTALVRSRAKLADITHPQLKVVVGNLLRPATLAAAVPGHDAVVLAAASQGVSETFPLAGGTANLIWQMQLADVTRLLVLSRQGAGASRKEMPLWWKLTMRRFNRAVFADHDEQEEKIRNSGLAWTVVRPTSLNDGPATGYVAAASTRELPSAARSSIARADVASFMLDQLTPSAPVRCSLTLAGAPVRREAPQTAPRGVGQWASASAA